jgi:hypothetical protein
VRLSNSLDLTYCTNIHPAEGWPAVFANLRRFAPALKARLSPDRPFGLGLRLSARDARELLGRELEVFHEWLDGEGLYVAVINGFPYGPFHGTPVKADVYAPDWRDPARVAYTLDLVGVLHRLLPAGMDGGVSTVPLSYTAWVPSSDRDAHDAFVRHVVRVAERLVSLRQTSGQTIHLDIEPEPDCVLETTDETIAWFEQELLPRGAKQLAAATGSAIDAARQDLLTHIRVCFDCCHASVEHEDVVAALDRLQQAGIQVGRIQLSSALQAEVPAGQAARGEMMTRLTPFADSTYLHQVICRGDRGLVHAPDLPEAIAAAPEGEWRIHFHVPLFAGDYDGLTSSQGDVRRVLEAVSAGPVTTHLEIETYTWDVLPPAVKLDLVESIGREYEWVLRTLGRR